MRTRQRNGASRGSGLQGVVATIGSPFAVLVATVPAVVVDGVSGARVRRRPPRSRRTVRRHDVWIFATSPRPVSASATPPRAQARRSPVPATARSIAPTPTPAVRASTRSRPAGARSSPGRRSRRAPSARHVAVAPVPVREAVVTPPASPMTVTSAIAPAKRALRRRRRSGQSRPRLHGRLSRRCRGIVFCTRVVGARRAVVVAATSRGASGGTRTWSKPCSRRRDQPVADRRAVGPVHADADVAKSNAVAPVL